MSFIATKKWWMDVAEVIDSLRIFPRAMVLAYGIWVAWFTDWIVSWYERIPAVERTTEVTAIFGIIIPGVMGLATWLFKMYLDGGRDWDKYRSLNASNPDQPH